MNTRKWLLAALICAASFSASAETRAVIDTSAGRIYLQLDEKKAPQTVANFVRYAEKGFYNGTVFHRVIDGFMIQGGGMTADLRPKATAAPIRNEADNGLENTTGSIAMARTAEPDSATSQFFINLADNDFLNHKSRRPQEYGYAVFGRVSAGMDVVRKIAAVRTGSRGPYQNVPLEPVVIRKVSIER